MDLWLSDWSWSSINRLNVSYQLQLLVQILIVIAYVEYQCVPRRDLTELMRREV